VRLVDGFLREADMRMGRYMQDRGVAPLSRRNPVVVQERCVLASITCEPESIEAELDTVPEQWEVRLTSF
jgi:hypothetical protein